MDSYLAHEKDVVSPSTAASGIALALAAMALVAASKPDIYPVASYVSIKQSFMLAYTPLFH